MDLAAALAKKISAVNVAHRTNWRRWAEEIAADKAMPDPLDVLEAAAALAIDNPGSALTQDAETLRELATVERAIVSCQTARAETLKPWNGSIDKLRAALEKAQTEAKRLREQLDSLDNASEGFWRHEAYRLRRGAPRLFSEEN